MAQGVQVSEVSSVLTREEIANLAAEGGQPAETLMNVVALIARRFRNRRLFGVPAGARPRQPGAGGDGRPAPECIGTLRMALHEGLAGLVAEQVRPVAVEQVKNHPRFKYFREAGEDEYQSFLGVPLIDRGVLQGVLVVQTIAAARVSATDEMHMLVEAAAQVAPVVSEARTLDRFIAPVQERLWALARNLWWSWDHDSVGLFLRAGSGSAGGKSITTRFRCWAKCRWPKVERGAAELVLHSRINYAYRRQREYLQADRTWGAHARGRSAAAPGGLFLGGIRAARIDAGLFGRAGRAGGRPHQERVGSGHSAGWRRIVLWAGIFPAAAGRERLAAGRISADRRQPACRWKPAIGKEGVPVTVQIETRGGTIRAKVWRVKVGRCDLLLLDSMSKAMLRKIAS